VVNGFFANPFSAFLCYVCVTVITVFATVAPQPHYNLFPSRLYKPLPQIHHVKRQFAYIKQHLRLSCSAGVVKSKPHIPHCFNVLIVFRHIKIIKTMLFLCLQLRVHYNPLLWSTFVAALFLDAHDVPFLNEQRNRRVHFLGFLKSLA